MLVVAYATFTGGEYVATLCALAVTGYMVRALAQTFRTN